MKLEVDIEEAEEGVTGGKVVIRCSESESKQDFNSDLASKRVFQMLPWSHLCPPYTIPDRTPTGQTEDS